MTDDEEKVYNLAEAAAACSVSLPTIRRRKDQLVEAGAVVDPKGWRIPHSALVAAGFAPSWTANEKPQEPPVTDAEHVIEETVADRNRALEDHVRRLESENMILRSYLEKWQALSAERLDALNDLRAVFRTLPMTAPRQIEPPEPAAPTERQSWWKRTFG